LRTTFAEKDGRPAQIISPEGQPALIVIHLPPLPAAERENEVTVQMGEAARRPFDLSSGPLLRINLWQLAENEFLLLVVMHHIISDAWSLSIFFKELSELYGSYVDGRSAALAPLPLQYTEYAQNQRTRLQGEVLARQSGYWKKQLKGLQEVLRLPADHPRPPTQSFRGASYEIGLTEAVSQKVKAFGRREKVTPFMVLLAAFNLLLHRR
jgi:hypothetical protein